MIIQQLCFSQLQNFIYTRFYYSSRRVAFAGLSKGQMCGGFSPSDCDNHWDRERFNMLLISQHGIFVKGGC